MIKNAVSAQKQLEQLSDINIDQIITDIVKKIDLQYWAQEELNQTQIGNLKDKIHKLSLVTDRVYRELFGVKTFGRLNSQTPYIEFAAPIGVIFAIVPLTNPVPNGLFKILNCLKTRNSVIFSFPRKAQAIGLELVKLIQDILLQYHLSIDLVQAIQTPSREITHQVMQHPDVALILATGGGSLVKAAYSSGTPAIGVGPGNVPVYMGKTANIKNAVQSIIASKTYDNGIVCGSESNIIVDSAIYDDVLAELKHQNVLVLKDDKKIAAFVSQNFDHGVLKREKIGVEANRLIEGNHVLVVVEGQSDFPFLLKEKMTPLLTIVCSDIERASELLWQEGTGHTAVIHSHDQQEIEIFAEKLPAGRILVNLPATQGMLGMGSDIPLSFMQGSGTWGGNGSTAPITWRDLVNIKRLSYAH